MRARAGPRAVVQAVAPAKKAFFFPGQGAQSVGMAKELCEECPAAAELFEKASAILGYDLLDVRERPRGAAQLHGGVAALPSVASSRRRWRR